MNTAAYRKTFENFYGRERALRKVTRYYIYKPMYYRSDLLAHSRHVNWLVEEMTPIAENSFGPVFNVKKTSLMACVHDDFEIVLGDIQAGHKYSMTREQLDDVANRELTAIAETVKRFPKTVGVFDYRDLLHEVQEGNTIESQVVKYADKMDAFGEALHEIYAGNAGFITPIEDPIYGTVISPSEYYALYLSSREKNFPRIVKMFESRHPLFEKPSFTDFQKIVKRFSPHTRESFNRPTGNVHYDEWKRIMTVNADENELKRLVTQVEF
ncbi:MAG: YfbR-like 5'-deoxynucleotidase [Parcubacteria group bacterium]